MCTQIRQLVFAVAALALGAPRLAAHVAEANGYRK